MKIVLNTFWNANTKGLFLIVSEKDGSIIKDGFESLEAAIEWKENNK